MVPVSGPEKLSRLQEKVEDLQDRLAALQVPQHGNAVAPGENQREGGVRPSLKRVVGVVGVAGAQRAAAG